MSKPQKPIIITAFANDYQEGTHLSYLSDEIDGINNALNGQKLRSFFDVVTISNANIERISEKLTGIDYQNRIVAFHYGGHADSRHLMLQSTTGTTELAKADTLADFLGQQEQLQLVFLNGCSTKGQVKKLKEVGVPHIIATDRSIDDNEASSFAVQFYLELAEGERNISKLFERAKTALKSTEVKKRIQRKLFKNREFGKDNFSWGLYQINEGEAENLGEWFVNHNIEFLTTAPPPPPEAFRGRQKDLVSVHQLLKDKDNVVLVKGIGGIGKSTLAQAYWYKHQHQYAYIAWISVVNDNVEEAFINSGLERRLGITPFEKDTLSQRYQNLQRKLSKLDGIKLLILDNINDASAVHKFELPNWKVLITSRTSIDAYEKHTHTLGLLGKVDAKDLFINYYNPAREQTDLLENLLESIGYHTLTIELLAKNLNKLHRRNYFLTNLCNDLEEKGLLKPKKASKIHTEYRKGEADKYPQIVSAVFDIQPLNEYERWILLQFAVLPSVYISYSDISNFLQIEDEIEELFDDTLDELEKKGWLEYNNKNEQYKLHQVIQEVIRTKISPTIENCGLLVESFTKKMKLAKGENPLNKAIYSIYSYTLLKCLYEIESNQIAILCNYTGIIYRSMGEYEKSLKLCKRAVSIQEQALHPKHIDLSTSYHYTATTYRELGQYKLALDFQEKAIIIQEKILGTNHIMIASSYGEIATIYRYLGDFDEALIFQQKDIAILEEILDKKHPELALSYNNLSIIYNELGKHSLSLEFFSKALAIQEEILDPKHPELASTYVNIAETYRVTGNYLKAIEFQKKALAIQKEIFDTEHPELAISYNNIGSTYKLLKQNDLALIFQEKSIKIFESIFDSKHPKIAITYNNIANIYQDLKNYTKTLEYQQKAVTIFEEVFDSEHPNLAVLYGNIGRTYQFLGDYEKALSYQQKDISIIEKALDSKHVELAISYYNIAKTYHKSKQYSPAKKYIDQSISIFRYNFPNGHDFLDLAVNYQIEIIQSTNSKTTPK